MHASVQQQSALNSTRDEPWVFKNGGQFSYRTKSTNYEPPRFTIRMSLHLYLSRVLTHHVRDVSYQYALYTS